MVAMQNDLNQVCTFLQSQDPNSLPGIDAQLLLAPPMRAEELKSMNTEIPKRQSAILILLFQDEGKVKTLMMKRSSRLHHHAGQISFPGGQIEAQDSNSWETAIRETEEETGIERSSIKKVLRLSDLFIPPSNFNVEVYVGTLDTLPTLTPNSDEVDELIQIPLDLFMDSNSIEELEFEVQEGRFWKAPSYIYQSHHIWGASAMMMSELIEVLKKMPA